MHDKVLLHKICEEVKNLCVINDFTKVNNLEVTVNHLSYVNEANLYDSLKHISKKIFGPWTKIEVNRDDIQDQTAIIHSIEGIKSDEKK